MNYAWNILCFLLFYSYICSYKILYETNNQTLNNKNTNLMKIYAMNNILEENSNQFFGKDIFIMSKLPRIQVISSDRLAIRIYLENIPNTFIIQNRIEITLWFSYIFDIDVFHDPLIIPFSEIHLINTLTSTYSRLIQLDDDYMKYYKIKALLRLSQDENQVDFKLQTSTTTTTINNIPTMMDECIILKDNNPDLSIVYYYHSNYSMNNTISSNISLEYPEIYVYINSIEQSLDLSLQNISKLSSTELTWKGFSGLQFRHFLNNLIRLISKSIDNTIYLEIGIL